MRFFSSKSRLACGCLVLSLLLSLSCGAAPVQNSGNASAGQSPVKAPPPAEVSQEASQEIALDFLRNGPTFRFDGIASTLRLTGSEAGAKAGSWLFRYEFQCRQAGYGDRTGMVLAQIIISHRAEIVVQQGKVTFAVLDTRWDELTQKTIQ